jgi:hypothetical protein
MSPADMFLKAMPEKIITYGGPEDSFTLLVDTFRKEDDNTVIIDRSLLLKKPIEHICLTLKLGEDVPPP